MHRAYKSRHLRTHRAKTSRHMRSIASGGESSSRASRLSKGLSPAEKSTLLRMRATSNVSCAPEFPLSSDTIIDTDVPLSTQLNTFASGKGWSTPMLRGKSTTPSPRLLSQTSMLSSREAPPLPRRTSLRRIHATGPPLPPSRRSLRILTSADSSRTSRSLA